MSLIFVLQSLNSAQFLNITCTAALSDFFLWASPPAAIAAIVLVTAYFLFPVTKIYASG